MIVLLFFVVNNMTISRMHRFLFVCKITCVHTIPRVNNIINVVGNEMLQHSLIGVEMPKKIHPTSAPE